MGNAAHTLRRSFWPSLFLGSVVLENHPEVGLLVVRRKKLKEKWEYRAIAAVTANGRSLQLDINSGSDAAAHHFSWWGFKREEVEPFVAALRMELTYFKADGAQEDVLAFWALCQHYLKDRDLDACYQLYLKLAPLYDEIKEKLWELSPLGAAEQKFCCELFSLASPRAGAAEIAALARKLFEDYALTKYASFLDQVEKYPLNAEQRLAVVRNNERNLILAAAGTGKTSVIAAKALHLIKNQAVAPGKILIMAFNRSAAQEIRERYQQAALRVGLAQVEFPEISTFHALGRHVLQDSGHSGFVSKFESNQSLLLQWIDQWLYTYLSRSKDVVTEFIKLFMSTITFDQITKEHTQEADEDKKSPAFNYQTPKTYRTLSNDEVKSKQEAHIADWLYLNGVPFGYEDRYFIKLRLNPGFDYRPDFHISDSNIYLEHFGIDREGHTAPGIDEQAYNALIEKKRETHKKYGTVLLETYSFQFDENTIDETLTDLMRKHGIKLRPRSGKELLNTVAHSKYHEELLILLQRCLGIIRTYGYSKADLEQLFTRAKLRSAERYAAILDELHRAYCQELSNQNAIDFNDMIIRARALIEDGSYVPKYQAILIDEFQDISLNRLKLLQALVNHSQGAILSCVGDDWQAIYHFAGGFLDATTHFERYWGESSLTKLVQTYRYPPSINNTAARFVQQNPEQFKKDVVTHVKDQAKHVHLENAAEQQFSLAARLYCKHIRDLWYVHPAVSQALRTIDLIGQLQYAHPEATIAVISRYKAFLEETYRYLKTPQYHPAAQLLHSAAKLGLSHSEVEYLNQLWLGQVQVELNDKLKFWTMHAAKGLEADFVIIQGLFGGRFYSFPCTIENDQLINALLTTEETFPNAEERRLFYVALTRARKECYLIADSTQPMSDFLGELLAPSYELDICSEFYQKIYLKIFKCPYCATGYYQKVQSQFTANDFYYRCDGTGCGNIARSCPECGYPAVDHKNYAECLNPNCKVRIPICERCGRKMVKRNGRYGEFYGCSGYGLPDDSCSFTVNLERMERFLKSYSAKEQGGISVTGEQLTCSASNGMGRAVR